MLTFCIFIILLRLPREVHEFQSYNAGAAMLRFVLFIFIFTTLTTYSGTAKNPKINPLKWVAIPGHPGLSIALTGETDTTTDPGKTLYKTLFKDEEGDIYDEVVGKEGEHSKEGFSISKDGRTTVVEVRDEDGKLVLIFTTIDD